MPFGVRRTKGRMTLHFAPHAGSISTSPSRWPSSYKKQTSVLSCSLLSYWLSTLIKNSWSTARGSVYNLHSLVKVFWHMLPMRRLTSTQFSSIVRVTVSQMCLAQPSLHLLLQHNEWYLLPLSKTSLRMTIHNPHI